MAVHSKAMAAAACIALHAMAQPCISNAYAMQSYAKQRMALLFNSMHNAKLEAYARYLHKMNSCS